MTCGAIGTVGSYYSRTLSSPCTPLRPEFGDCEDCGDKVLFPCSYSGDCVYSLHARQSCGHAFSPVVVTGVVGIIIKLPSLWVAVAPLELFELSHRLVSFGGGRCGDV
jgi:hypothetical protein